LPHTWTLKWVDKELRSASERKKIKIACYHYLLHNTITIKEGNDIVAVIFFIVKPSKKAMVIIVVIFCNKAIEEDDGSYHLLFLYNTTTEEGDNNLVPLLSLLHKNPNKY
jgi:hypothetical protein